MNRRAFLETTAALTAFAKSALPLPEDATSAHPAPVHPVIDTHTHFYDTRRPGGVPWPSKKEPVLYRPILPAEFRKLSQPFGITGTIEVEASPLLEDNQWVLDLAARNPIIVGTVGDLEPGQVGFRANLERFHRNRLFCGIRIGDLWGRSLAAGLESQQYIADLKALAEAGLEADTVGDPSLLAMVVKLTDRVPDLRVVVDHLPYDPPQDRNQRSSYERAMRELGKRPQVYIKVSNVVRRVKGAIQEDLAFYRPALDELWDVFGPDRLVYGSNWPVSNLVAPYATVFRIVHEYFAGKGREASEKYFFKNAASVYRWPGTA